MLKIINCLLSFALLFAVANEAFSQKKVITAQKDTWIDFVSEEGGYKIKFPVKPKRLVSKIDAAFGRSDIVQNRVLMKEYFMMVGFIDFPSEIADEEEIKLRYDNSIRGVVAGGNNRLISVKDIELNGYLGREAVIQSGNLILFIREFIMKQRFYMLQFVIPQNLPKNRQNPVQKLRDKFFGSFEVTDIPEAKFKPAVLPDDFGVSTKGNIFLSSYFGFSMQMPQGFAFFNEETLQTLREIAENEIQTDDSIQGNNNKISLKKTAILGGAVNDNASSIMIGAEAVFSIIQLELAAKEIRKNHARTDKITKDLFKTKIGNLDFYRFEVIDKDGQKQVLLMTLRENLLFEIVFTYKNDDDLRWFEESLKTIKFATPKSIEAKNLFEKNTENAVSGLFIR